MLKKLTNLKNIIVDHKNYVHVREVESFRKELVKENMHTEELAETILHLQNIIHTRDCTIADYKLLNIEALKDIQAVEEILRQMQETHIDKNLVLAFTSCLTILGLVTGMCLSYAWN